jgi:predicted nucleotidyltransferase
MSLIQKIVILFNVRPFTYIFHAIYASGLRILVNVLSKHEAVYAVFGTGSFFENRCLYGLSDIDLLIVVDARFTRIDVETYQITESYNRIRRIFPFLGDWHEKAESLIFLSEVQAGFPLLDSFKFLWKQKRLTQLYGKTIPEDLIAGSITSNEAVIAINTLIRMILTKNIILTTNLLFWKKMFSKLMAIAEVLSFDDIVKRIKTHDKLRFMELNDRKLFTRKSMSNELFSIFIELVKEVFRNINKKEESVYLKPTPLGINPQENSKDLLNYQAKFKSNALSEIHYAIDIGFKTIPSSLLGMAPRLNYFPMDGSIPVIELNEAVFDHIKLICKFMNRHGKEPESYLVQVPGLLFIVCKIQSYVDVIPLDPLIYANIYGQFQNQNQGFSMPSTIYDAQITEARNMFKALAGLYIKNDGWVDKMSIPCYYMEDDLVVIKDAFHCMRVYLLHTENVDISDLNELVRYIGAKYNECKSFLVDTLEYYRHLNGNNEKKRHANNIYRCLHQFMPQLLTGASHISMDQHKKRLGITVGIITRNRATDLEEALESLTKQVRPADEVLVVDNGSTDTTKLVIEAFEKLLPISYYFLESASIPLARNMVIENAQHEIISFTDDDCIVEPGWLDAVERGFLRADNVGIVGGWVKHEPAPVSSMIDTYYSLYHHYTT